MGITGYRVQYSDDGEEVCIIPDRGIPMEHSISLTKMYGKLGFDLWLPSDERQGYILRKSKKSEE